MAAKKASPFKPKGKEYTKGFEKKESMKTEKMEPMMMQKRERKMGVEKPMPFKCGGKVKGK